LRTRNDLLGIIANEIHGHPEDCLKCKSAFSYFTISQLCNGFGSIPQKQGSLNFFVRGPDKLLLNSPRTGHLTRCDCFGKCYILPNQHVYETILFFFNGKMYSRTLETLH